MADTNERNTVYGKTIETLAKIIKFDNSRDSEFGTYENVLIVPVILSGEENLTEYQKDRMARKGLKVPEVALKDSEIVVKVGTREPAMQEALKIFRERIAKKEFSSCYAYISGTPSESCYKDGRKFINLRPEIIDDLAGDDLLEEAKRLKKANALWDGIVRPKETSVKSETTSNTYANAWD